MVAGTPDKPKTPFNYEYDEPHLQDLQANLQVAVVKLFYCIRAQLPRLPTDVPRVERGYQRRGVTESFVRVEPKALYRGSTYVLIRQSERVYFSRTERLVANQEAIGSIR